MNSCKFHIQGSVILSLRADLGCKQGIHSHLLLCVSGQLTNWSWSLPLKGLGAVKSWSGELDKSQNLRSGYKSTWHDSETESLCTCEVVGGEQFSV